MSYTQPPWSMKRIHATAVAALALSLGLFAFTGILGSVYAAPHEMTANENGTMTATDKMTSMSTETAADISGDLTAPMTPGKPPFGGEKLGTFAIDSDDDWTQVQARIDLQPSEGKVFEGWLVDDATGYRLSIGEVESNGTLTFSQNLVNHNTYNAIVITEEPLKDPNPYPAVPIAGSMLPDPFGQ
jgi:hypothetical protein